MLKVEHISKNYGNNRGIQDISFVLKPGKLLGVLGSNGSGKTTTFRILLGLLEADEGTITYHGKEIDSTNTCLFGYLPEERSMLRDLRVQDQIMYLGRLKHMPDQKIQSEMIKWLEFLDITKYQYSKIVELSKGNQQKVQLICALVHCPDIYIFDEPLNGLDIENVLLFQAVIKQLQKEKKLIMISSHQYQVIEKFCDSVMYLQDGKLLFQGRLQQLKRESLSCKVIIQDSTLETWENISGVIEASVDNNQVILRMDSHEKAEKVIKKAMKLGIQEYALMLPSLAEIIQERLYERTY